jgi:hypothetical protein
MAVHLKPTAGWRGRPPVDGMADTRTVERVWTDVFGRDFP